MKKLFLIAIVALAAFSCRKEDTDIYPSDPQGMLVNPSESVTGGIEGFFLLNEGLRGTNRATLDYYDYSTGRYHSDVFTKNNPGEMGLGDIGNDMKVYNGRLYIVLNGSNFVDVLDAKTAKLIKKIAIPSPRFIAFADNYAYVTSYAGAEYGASSNNKGHVARIDLTSFEVTNCEVGYQPDELAVVAGKLYVANSGGYQSTYETTVSVIDPTSFAVTGTIEVAPNLFRVRPDGTGKLYVSSRGDYNATPAATYVVDTATGEAAPAPVVYADNIALGATTLYAIGVSYPEPDYKPTPSYFTYNMTTGQAGGSFITDASAADITAPYGLAVHPANGEVFVADAGDYKSNGVLHCYTPAGKHKWSVSTSVSPSVIAFTTTKLQ